MPPEPDEFTDLLDRIEGISIEEDEYAAIPEPYELIPELRIQGKLRIAVEASYKLMAGIAIDRTEFRLLAEFASEGAKVRWLRPPPPHAFDLLRESTESRFRQVTAPQR